MKKYSLRGPSGTIENAFAPKFRRSDQRNYDSDVAALEKMIKVRLANPESKDVIQFN